MSKHLQNYRPHFLDEGDDFWSNPWDFHPRFPSLFRESERLIAFPRVDIKDEPGRIIVTANLPGIPAKDVNIEVDGAQLTLSGHSEREHEEGGKDSDYYRMEREEGSFSRTLTLPAQVMRENIDATMKNGVLTVTLQKNKEPTKPKIEVRER